jgi:hypothetical protein
VPDIGPGFSDIGHRPGDMGRIGAAALLFTACFGNKSVGCDAGIWRALSGCEAGMCAVPRIAASDQTSGGDLGEQQPA